MKRVSRGGAGYSQYTNMCVCYVMVSLMAWVRSLHDLMVYRNLTGRMEEEEQRSTGR